MFDKVSRKYYMKYILSFLLGVVVLIGVDYIQLELPKIFKNIINSIEDGSILTNNDIIVDTIIKISVITILMFIGRYLWRYFLIGAGIKIEYDIRNNMFYNLKELDQSFFNEHKTGALMAYFTNDLTVLKEFYGRGTMMIVDFLFLGVLVLVKLFQISWLLTVVSLSTLFILFGLYTIIRYKIKRSFREKQEAYERLSDFTQENFQGIRVIKGFCKEHHQIEKFDEINHMSYKKEFRFTKHSMYSDLMMNIISLIVLSTIIVVGVWFVINHEIENAGSFVEYLLLFDTLVWPLNAIGMYFTLQAQAKAAMKRVRMILETKSELVNNESDLKIKSGEIEFKNFNFRFSDAKTNILSNLNIKINNGEMIGILGKTGSGKSTISDILTRIYNVERNTLFIDGKDIMDIGLKEVRRNIKTVSQDNFLFNKTIKENIEFGSEEEVKEEDLLNVVDIAELKTAIESFKEGIEKVCGEKGTTLSGGQKQRVTIARALISDPEILILDDSMSALDIKTEKKILNHLKEIRKNKTTILISHRTQTIKDLDKIIVINQGEVNDIGTHDELMKNSIIYQQMYNLQHTKGDLSNAE